MLILALDTSSPSGSVAILRDDLTLGVVSTRAEENYSSRMFRHLEFLLSDLTLKLQDFDVFAVSAGPGSFTGLRVGLTAAKGWAEVYRKPVVGVSALAAVASQARGDGTVLVPALDARRGQIYFGVYRATADGLALEGEEFVVTPEEFAEKLGALAQGGDSDAKQGVDSGHYRSVDSNDGAANGRGGCGFTIVTPDASVVELVSRLTPQLTAEFAGLDVVSSVLAPSIGRIAQARALHGEVSDALTLDANYVRRTDAEMRWKDG